MNSNQKIFIPESPNPNFEKYRNPDVRCKYPFEPCPVGYCWSYANNVDGTPGYEDIRKICDGCEEYVQEGTEWTRL